MNNLGKGLVLVLLSVLVDVFFIIHNSRNDNMAYVNMAVAGTLALLGVCYIIRGKQ